ncbi:hypothetical protein GOBAR_AA32098 [Gossypium barbadense]|uniref:Endonuclease/exonuclease/phosphatase domain-containing protein n=1 Tax=Gossypium barbadense TaxID=3634 RepID=A0A2P5WBY3_GOSBA|nr:hypothetical protein GOBAR_AA32098 [Gossypium barbadense]
MNRPCPSPFARRASGTFGPRSYGVPSRGAGPSGATGPFDVSEHRAASAPWCIGCTGGSSTKANFGPPGFLGSVTFVALHGQGVLATLCVLAVAGHSRWFLDCFFALFPVAVFGVLFFSILGVFLVEFMCWNYRGLGNPAKLRELKQLLAANNPDLIFLSETKMSANDFRRVQNKCRMQNGLAVNSEGRSGGLTLMWRDGMNVSIQNYSKHNIDSLVKLENNKNIRVTGFYGHANPNLRSSSWDILQRVGESVREEWIVGGNFNAILNDAEKEDGRRGVRVQMNEFKEVMDELALVDIKPDSGWFTWVNNRSGGD